MKEAMTTRKLTLMALLLSMSLIIFTIEAQLPPPVALPGVKWGLANVVTLVAIFLVGKKEAGTILFLRIMLTAIMAGSGIICGLITGLAAKFTLKALARAKFGGEKVEM